LRHFLTALGICFFRAFTALLFLTALIIFFAFFAFFIFLAIIVKYYLDIIFTRPTPVVTLKSDIKDYSGVKIVITSPRNKEKSVIVWMSGQVSIE